MTGVQTCALPISPNEKNAAAAIIAADAKLAASVLPDAISAASDMRSFLFTKESRPLTWKVTNWMNALARQNNSAFAESSATARPARTGRRQSSQSDAEANSTYSRADVQRAFFELMYDPAMDQYFRDMAAAAALPEMDIALNAPPASLFSLGFATQSLSWSLYNASRLYQCRMVADGMNGRWDDVIENAIVITEINKKYNLFDRQVLTMLILTDSSVYLTIRSFVETERLAMNKRQIEKLITALTSARRHYDFKDVLNYSTTYLIESRDMQLTAIAGMSILDRIDFLISKPSFIRDYSNILLDIIEMDET